MMLRYLFTNMKTFAERANELNPSRAQAFAHIDKLREGAVAGSRACERDLEALMEIIKADMITFSAPVDCLRWGVVVKAVEQRSGPAEDLGISFWVSFGGSDVEMAACEAPSFVFQAAYHAVERIVVETLEKRAARCVVSA